MLINICWSFSGALDIKWIISLNIVRAERGEGGMGLS